MTEKQIPEVAALEQTCFSHPWSEESLQKELRSDSSVFLVAVDDSETVLGYAGLLVVLDEGYITNIATDPRYRRQGVAGALLSALLQFGRPWMSFITLEVRASNEPAAALYRKLGFLVVGRRKNYYDDPREDAILMTKRFDHGIERDRQE